MRAWHRATPFAEWRCHARLLPLDPFDQVHAKRARVAIDHGEVSALLANALLKHIDLLANAAAAQTFDGLDETIQRDLAKAEQKEAVAKKKDAAAKKKLDAAQAAWEKTAAAVRSARAETGRLQKSLENNAKEKQSFGKLEEDLAAQSKAVMKMLEAVGEQVDDDGGASSSSRSSSSSTSSTSTSTSTSGSSSKRKGRGSSSRSSTRVSKRAKKGQKK